MLGIYHEAQRESLRVVCGVKEEHEEEYGKKDQGTRSDNEGEYTSNPFLQLCHDEGIKRHFTVREISQQYGVAERMNKTLLEKVWYMLSNAGISKSFWIDALAYACYLIN